MKHLMRTASIKDCIEGIHVEFIMSEYCRGGYFEEEYCFNFKYNMKYYHECGYVDLDDAEKGAKKLIKQLKQNS